MITAKCEQGTEEWRGIKAGVASPSNFDRLITASMKPSSQAEEYLYELLGEWIVGKCKELPPNLYWVNHGTNMEHIARQTFEIIHSDVTQVGFAYKDKRKLVGCSPDGFLDKKTGLEIKCPSPIIHNAYYLREECPKKYMPQVQGSMWVTGMSQWWFMSYHPDWPPLLVLVDADPVWQRAISQIVLPFTDRLAEMRLDKRVVELRQKRIDLEAAA